MGQVIGDSGRRLERLVENFLIYAQLELFSTDPVKISALRGKQTTQPVRVIGNHARRQAELVGRLADLELTVADASVPMSEEYLGKVVDELVQNALKFSSTGRRVRLELSETEAALTLSVSDLGRGFSTEQISRVGAYMQFDRKMHEQQGLGLGVSIARRLTELHGGTLAIQSQRGAGTTVQVRLPKVTAS
jgi:signal transduction histidine kinase